MKKSLITLFLITSVLAFSEISVKKVPYESMIKSDDGKVEATFSIKDGKLEGIERNYFPNGKFIFF